MKMRTYVQLLGGVENYGGPLALGQWPASGDARAVIEWSSDEGLRGGRDLGGNKPEALVLGTQADLDALSQGRVAALCRLCRAFDGLGNAYSVEGHGYGRRQTHAASQSRDTASKLEKTQENL